MPSLLRSLLVAGVAVLAVGRTVSGNIVDVCENEYNHCNMWCDQLLTSCRSDVFNDMDRCAADYDKCATDMKNAFSCSAKFDSCEKWLHKPSVAVAAAAPIVGGPSACASCMPEYQNNLAACNTLMTAGKLVEYSKCLMNVNQELASCTAQCLSPFSNAKVAVSAPMADTRTCDDKMTQCKNKCQSTAASCFVQGHEAPSMCSYTLDRCLHQQWDWDKSCESGYRRCKANQPEPDQVAASTNGRIMKNKLAAAAAAAN